MSNPAEQPGEPTAQTAHVTVKNMPVSAWNRANAARARSGETMAEWLARAVNQLADRESGERLILPGQPEQPGAANLPAPLAITPAEIEGLMRAAVEVSRAAEIPVPKVAARHFFALLTLAGRAARGLPPSNPRSNRGQTRPRIGQTIEAEAD